MKYIGLVILVFVSNLCLGQDIVNDIKKVQNAYECTENYTTKLETRGFENDKLIYSLDVSLLKHLDNYLIKTSLYDYLINDKYQIMVTHTDKSINYKNRDFKQEAKFEEFLRNLNVSATLDSMVQRYDTVIYTGTSNENKLYTFLDKGAMIERAIIYINTKTFFIEKVVYFYNESFEMSTDKIVINYENILLENTKDKKIISEKEYFRMVNGKAILQSKFSEYSIFDNTKDI